MQKAAQTEQDHSGTQTTGPLNLVSLTSPYFTLFFYFSLFWKAVLENFAAPNTIFVAPPVSDRAECPDNTNVFRVRGLWVSRLLINIASCSNLGPVSASALLFLSLLVLPDPLARLSDKKIRPSFQLRAGPFPMVLLLVLLGFMGHLNVGEMLCPKPIRCRLI